MLGSASLKVKVWLREVMVIGTLYASVVAMINTTCSGGSSRVFNSALKADFESI